MMMSSPDLSGRPADPTSVRSRLMSRSDLRQRILAARQAKKDELKQTLGNSNLLSLQDPNSIDERFSWYGVDQDAEGIPIALEDDDNESTVLGHSRSPETIFAPGIPAPIEDSSSDAAPPRDSFASEFTYSSTTSTSRGSLSQDDDSDTRSMQTLATVDEVSDHASRRASRSKEAFRRKSGGSRSDRPSSLMSNSSTRSKPLHPPPNMPLPPKPTSPASSGPNSPALASISGTLSPSWRKSNASAVSISSTSSGRKSFRELAVYPDLDRRASFSSDISCSSAELDSIRQISAFFPPPGPPPRTSLPSLPESRPGSSGTGAGRSLHSRSSLRSAGSGSTRGSHVLADSRSPWSPSSSSNRPLSRDQSALHSEPIVHGEAVEDDDDVSDEALSDVLHMSAPNGSLAMSPRPSLESSFAGSMTRVGLNLGSRASPLARSPQAMSPSTSSASLTASNSGSLQVPGPVDEDERRRRSLMRKSLNGLVAALDEEASRWVDDAQSPSASPRSSSNSASGPQRPDRQGPVLTITEDTQTDHVPPVVPEPSARNSKDDTGLLTASRRHSGLGRRSFESEGADAEISSIYSKYRRNSEETFNSVLSAPEVRIENADDDGSSSSDLDLSPVEEDGPRKRSKQNRRNGIGFEDQRAAPSRKPSQRSFTPGQIVSPAHLGSGSQKKDDPYAYYEFSPSLPPFVPSGLQPKDLTGTGTWSSIVARANGMVSRQASISSFSSLATTNTTGPVSLREIAAGARAKREQAEEARRLRESQSTQFSSMTYKPFEIHRHASDQARLESASYASSLSRASSRNTALSLSSMASFSTIGMANQWPVAVGGGSEDNDDVGTETEELKDDRHSFAGTGVQTSVRGSTSTLPAAKVYAEVCLQTSPASTPPGSPKLPAASIQTETPKAASKSKASKKVSSARKSLARRKTMAALTAAYQDDEDEIANWPSRTRAPRLSGRKSSAALERPTTTRKTGLLFSSFEDGDTELPATSSDESDLDVGAPLEVLAERSGALDEVRGAKRKITRGNAMPSPRGSPVEERRIATIPTRARLSSTPLANRRRLRPSSNGSGWTSSEDEREPRFETRKGPATPRPNGNLKELDAIPTSVPPKAAIKGSSMMQRSKSVSNLRPTSSRKSRPSLPVRADSPDLSVMTLDNEDEDSLLTVQLDPVMEKSEAAATRSSLPASSSQRDGLLTLNSARLSVPTSMGTLEPSDAVEIMRDADEILSTGHSADQHSSGHETISDTCGTSGHDPQAKPRDVLVEMARQRLALRAKVAPSPSTIISVADSNGAEAVKLPADAIEGAVEVLSPTLEDTPNTMAGSEFWSTLGGSDRNSSGSTATTWSGASVAGPDDDKRDVDEDADQATEQAETSRVNDGMGRLSLQEDVKSKEVASSSGAATSTAGFEQDEKSIAKRSLPTTQPLVSGLRTPSKLVKPGFAATAGRKSGTRASALLSQPSPSPSVTDGAKGLRSPLPIAASGLRMPSASAKCASGETAAGERRLRKMASMGDQMSTRYSAKGSEFVPPLPGTPNPAGNSVSVTTARRQSSTGTDRPKTPSSLPRMVPPTTPKADAKTLNKKASMSRLPMPVTPAGKSTAPAVRSGIPTPGGQVRKA